MLTFVVEIVPKTLVHRAVSLLASSRNIKDIKASWRLVTDDETTSNQILGKYEVKETDFVEPPRGLEIPKGDISPPRGTSAECALGNGTGK